MEHILHLTKENIQQVVDASMEKMVVMTFWAQQHDESVQLQSLLEQIALEQQGRFILAKVNCESEPEIAQYFQIQSLPTTLLLDKGRPVDGFAGSQSSDEIKTLLDKHLPAVWEGPFNDIKTKLADGNLPPEELSDAITALKQVHVESGERADVALVLADVYLMNGSLEEAKALLDAIGLADQDSYYQNLMAKLALAEEAADTPEIRNLAAQYQQSGDAQVAIALGKALHAAQRNDEALEVLFAILKKDLSAEDGQVKQAFMEILTAIGQGNALANQYRRQLYTLLY
ncbi:tetratricopeptide repeat protein [Shewanella sp. WXL01]|uniref:Tetratricopeptide repeat protein n=1 Tax=Shewanella maritima TaxID=2520507 RepID=A0A411PLE5_9GAMM|nr:MULTISPECIES: tetratricopeptide repeat protein [Shewanella]NKF52647.1 tetratricopeptide repeat protein [Shewanella sp. WXL01]QBF84304.1 tetratricopeptide repeat protein [Shewanella maritima]